MTWGKVGRYLDDTEYDLRRLPWNLLDLDLIAQEYADVATSVTGKTFLSTAWLDDQDHLAVELVPEVAHWNLLNPDGGEGVRLVEQLITAMACDLNVEGPDRRRGNGIWHWRWEDRGIRLDSWCVAEPHVYDEWCTSRDHPAYVTEAGNDGICNEDFQALGLDRAVEAGPR